MMLHLQRLAFTGILLHGVALGAPALAQKSGGILKMFSPDSPASMSILEEATAFSQRPMMAVFNNLVIYDQSLKQNSLASIVPDLATGWSWRLSLVGDDRSRLPGSCHGSNAGVGRCLGPCA